MSRANLRPGDLVFFFSDLHHMGLYVGGGWMVHAPTTGDFVRMAKIDSPYLPIAATADRRSHGPRRIPADHLRDEKNSRNPTETWRHSACSHRESATTDQ